MNKIVIVADYINTITSVFNKLQKESMRSNFTLKSSSTVYSLQNTPFIIFKKFINKIKDIGLLDLIRMWIKPGNAIILTGGANHFYRNISSNVIHLVHGAGIKSTPANHERSDNIKLDYYRSILRNTDYIICSRDDEAKFYLQSPELENEKRPIFLPLGLPRNDYLIENKTNPMIIQTMDTRLGIKKEKSKVILYAPTYREFPDENDSMLDFLLKQFDSLDKKLAKKNIYLLYRPHYLIVGLRHRFKQYTNIFYAGNDEFPEQRDLMIYSDSIITDYSSIYIDYLLLDRPVIFYPFDRERYTENRGLMLDYDNDVHFPGPKLKSLDEILKITSRELKKYDLEKSKNYFFKYPDGKATERIVHFILNDILRINTSDHHLQGGA